jgi:SAM-dependent methyltransferase
MPDLPDNGAHHLVTGAEYVAQITAHESDRRARAAFRDRVLGIASQGATVFDFGCGTGLDARFYAERGLRVFAYDADPQMCEFFRVHCRDLIDAGRVTLERGPYRDFLAAGGPAADRRVELVTANFAPLCLIDDLRELFATFHRLTAANGKVLASVLSPYFLGDLKYGWWWRNLLPLLRDGRYCVPGSQAPIFRRRLADFAGLSAPYFVLEDVFPGVPARHTRATPSHNTRPGTRGAWWNLTTCRFMFLLFARRAGVGVAH